MKKVFSLMVGMLVLCAFAAWAGPADVDTEPLGSSVSYKSDATVSSLTLPAGDVYTAWITIEGGNIRYFYDGSTPGPQSGHLGLQNTGIECRSHDEAANFKFTKDLATAGVTVTTTFFGRRQ